MQRKNSLLKRSISKKALHRDAMAMVMAISVLVIIGTILALSLSLTNKTVKKSNDLYLYEQAAILSHSAAEYVMLKISKVAPCSLDKLNFSYNNMYDINATMQYISVAGSSCETNAQADGTNLASTTYPDSNGTVILDISITSQANVAPEPIRYFRRTIQKL